MRARVAKLAGIVLITVSVLAILQTIRSLVFWEYGKRRYVLADVLTPEVEFGGHRFSVSDDQPFVVSGYSQTAVNGRIQLMMDGLPIGGPSRAEVRPSLAYGRYHLWYDARIIGKRGMTPGTLYLARKLRPTDSRPSRYEITTVTERGERETRILSAWQLGFDYRAFRATQFLTDSEWSVFPLSLDWFIPVWPILLLFPVGTMVVGVILMRRGRGRGAR